MAQFSCDFCGKAYTRKGSWDRHVLVCELAHKSKRLKQCEQEEADDVPSRTQLYALLQESLTRMRAMEETIAAMKKWMDKKRSKLNAIKWLTSQVAPGCHWEAFVLALAVTCDDIQVLFEKGFAPAALTILKTNLGQTSDRPIACFTEKTGVFYIFKLEPESGTAAWTKMTGDDLVFALHKIHCKLLNGLCTWRDENQERMDKCETVASAYRKTVIKLMGAADMSGDFSNIRSPLHTFLQTDLKNLVQEVEYEF